MNESKIPLLSFKKKLLSSEINEDIQQSVPPLGDLTNTTHTLIDYQMSTKAAMNPNIRLMNKYYYGDPRVIEEVKKRERKIMKDISHFKKSIQEIDQDIALIQNETIPNLKYELSKKSTIFKELRQESINSSSELDNWNNKCDLIRKNNDLFITNLSLQQSVELQRIENDLTQKLNEIKKNWEHKLLEMENYQPSKEIIEELKHLNDEKAKKQNELHILHVKNQIERDKCLESLNREFEKFKQKKLESLEESQTKYHELFKEKVESNKQVDNLVSQISDFDAKILELQSCIKENRKLLLEEQENNAPVELELNKLQTDFSVVKKNTEEIKNKAQIIEKEYNIMFDKMEEEQWRRRTMEDSIDILKGKIRCFVYVNPEIGYDIDYSTREIFTVFEKFQFNKMIPKNLITSDELFTQECYVYLTTCIQNHDNCNIISLFQSYTKDIKISFINFLLKQKFKYIYFQNVMLSEDPSSIDMLISSEEGKSNEEINVTINKDSIIFNSHSVKITPETNISDIFSTIKRYPDVLGLSVLKFTLWYDEYSSSDIYFLEIGDNLVDSLEFASRLYMDANKPISAVLQMLLSCTKSLLILNLTEINDRLLQICKSINQLDNPKTSN